MLDDKFQKWFQCQIQPEIDIKVILTRQNVARHDRLGHVQGHHERMPHTKKTQQYKKRAEQDETNISHELCGNIALSSFILKL